MSRILLARGPAVEALRRYDPGLRVRWSHEKQKWAVDAPLIKGGDTIEVLPPPVRYERVGEGDQFVEHLLPEYSERKMQFKDQRYVVCYSKTTDWPLFSAVVQHDGHRHRKGMVGLFDDTLKQDEAAKSKQEQYERSERVYAAFDRYKHITRKMGANAESGAGVSIKGMK